MLNSLNASFKNEYRLLEFSCIQKFKLVLNDCKIYFKKIKKYDYIDEDFIDRYFDYLPTIVDFYFDFNKKYNTVIIYTSLPFKT